MTEEDFKHIEVGNTIVQLLCLSTSLHSADAVRRDNGLLLDMYTCPGAYTKTFAVGDVHPVRHVLNILIDGETVRFIKIAPTAVGGLTRSLLGSWTCPDGGYSEWTIEKL